MSEPGYFVSLEGGDGSGKTTQARLLGDWLGQALGREVLVTREPGGTTLGLELRRLVLHSEDMDPRTEALLYAADRAHHVAALIRPALERGALVITDRYLDSSVAYQAGGRELSEDEVERLSLWAVHGLLPDLTVLLDVDLATSAERMPRDLDRLERVDDAFRQRTRDAYRRRAAADPARWVVVDACGTVQEVQARVQAAVAERLGLARSERLGLARSEPVAPHPASEPARPRPAGEPVPPRPAAEPVAQPPASEPVDTPQDGR